MLRVIASQVDVFPAQWRQVPQQGLIDCMAVAAQGMRGPLHLAVIRVLEQIVEAAVHVRKQFG